MDDMRRAVRALYEEREQIGARITALHRQIDALRDSAVAPLAEQCEAIDAKMNDLLGAFTWVEGRYDEAGLPVLE